MPRAPQASAGPDWSLERAARRAGHLLIAGVDEAGRGCLFGPVYAAAVILDESCRLPGLDDSKRLTPARREDLEVRIRGGAVAWSVQAVDAASIDLLNILEATRLAMRRAVESLAPAPDFLLTDWVRIDTGVPQKGIAKGDRRSRSIAAASILAKVARDRCLLAWDTVYPEYGLRRHKGYATQAHLSALREHGCTPLHRRSFAPVGRLAPQRPYAGSVKP